MKILVLTLGDDNFKDIMDITSYNKKNYAWKNGYDFVEIRHSLDVKRPPSWSKILAVRSEFCSPVYDWIFWTDPDSLVMNGSIRLESIIDEKFDMIFPFDDNGLNAGNWLIKNSPLSLNFLHNVYNQTQFLNHPWWEQKAIHYLQEQYKSNIKLVPANIMNSHPFSDESKIYKDGDFIIHFSGMHKNEKLKGIRDYVTRAR